MKILFIALIYFVAAKLGFYLAIDPGNVTAVFPSSGIALGALIVFGWRVWPGVFLGSFLVNCHGFFSGQEDVGVWSGIFMAGAMGIGASLQGLLGRVLLLRETKMETLFDRSQNIFTLFFFSGLASCLINATIGVTSLCLGSVGAWENYQVMWVTWWLGDSVGVFLFAPLVIWLHNLKPAVINWKYLSEYILIFSLVVILSGISYCNWFIPDISSYPLQFIVIPSLLWITLRYGESGIVPAITISSIISIWGTVNGEGPFSLNNTNASLLALQSYIGIIFLTFLVLNTFIKQRAEERKNAEIANSAKSSFLSRMSHELRTPLNAIMGFSQLLMVNPSEPLTSIQKKNIDTIHDAGGHLLALIDEILDLSQVEAGVIPLYMEPVEISTVMDEVILIVKPVAAKEGISLSIKTDPDSQAMIQSDRMRLKQVLMNLVSNGIKYNKRGGFVEIVCDRVSEGKVRIHVNDNGVGIMEDQISKLFKPFERLGAEKTKIQGTGIGLTIVQKLLVLLEGEISVESQVGKGSRFTIEFPGWQKKASIELEAV